MQYVNLFRLWLAGRRHATLRAKQRHLQRQLDQLAVEASLALDRVLAARNRVQP